MKVIRIDPQAVRLSVESKSGIGYYTGPIADNKSNGPKGKHESKNGVYEGTFKDGKWEGQGIFTGADGYNFKGTFQAGMKEYPGKVQNSFNYLFI